MLIDTTQLLSLPEAAKRAGPILTESQIRGRIRRGDIEPVWIGSTMYITIEQLEGILKCEGVK